MYKNKNTHNNSKIINEQLPKILKNIELIIKPKNGKDIIFKLLRFSEYDGFKFNSENVLTKGKYAASDISFIILKEILSSK